MAIAYKNKQYYENLDKRTKEYKQWKEWYDAQPKGLGDSIEKITEATGIKNVVESAAKALGMEDCGCDKRRKKLNKFVKYTNPECLTEDEFIWLSEFFEKNRTRVTFPEQTRLLDIYNRTFHRDMQPTSCGGCLRKAASDLRSLLKAHKE